MEGVFSGQPTAVVPTPVARQGQEVLLLEAFHPTNCSKTYKSEEAQICQDLRPIKQVMRAWLDVVKSCLPRKVPLKVFNLFKIYAFGSNYGLLLRILLNAQYKMQGIVKETDALKAVIKTSKHKP